MASAEYAPQLATLVAAPPSGDEWLHEIKFDGYRIGAIIRGGAVRLFTRNGHDWTATYPEIVAALERLGLDEAAIDGEVAVVLPDGRTSFQALQHASSRAAHGGTLVYFAFDLLRIDGVEVAPEPLEARKARLHALLDRRTDPRLRFSSHVIGQGPAFLAEARRLGLEGVVSKRRDLPHSPGRQGGWLKTKCVRRQEFVIAGFTDQAGTRHGIGALLIACYDGARLVFSGKVGTGFTRQDAVSLRAALERLASATCPLTPPLTGAQARAAHWVRPELVCEVVFTEWTAEGRVRHPSFRGLRADTPPASVTREPPASA